MLSAMKTFKDFYNSLSHKEARGLAERAETTTQYLYQLSTNRRKAGAGVIERLMAADDRITFTMMRGSNNG